MIAWLLACATVTAPQTSDPAAEPSISCPVGAACTRSLAEGDYVVQTPAGEPPESGWPVLVFFHGYRGSPDKFVADTDEATTLSEAGIAWLLPVSAGDSWSMGGDWSERDDRVFLTEALADLGTVLPVDTDRIYISGQSAGGSMAHEMACLDGDTYAAYAPMAGVFFTPLPTSCPADPAPLHHRHGSADTTWPLEGRDFGSVSQGDVAEVMELWAELYGCRDVILTEEDERTCTQWTGCADDVALSWCLDGEGHSPPAGWTRDLVAFFQE